MATVVTVDGAYKSFRGGKILNGLTLEVKDGDRIALLGSNGAGKTTLVRSILGFYQLDSGEIRVDGFNPSTDRVEVLKRVSFIPQLPPPIKLSVKELLEFIRKSSDTDPKDVREYALALKLDLAINANKPFFKLSGGMKQKLLIAIALAKRSRLLIFDEPTTSLDPRARESFYNLLKGLDYSYSAIYVTHRIEELEGLLNREIYMELGEIVEDEQI